ncbi:MAG TPA: DUF4147 domain-containing protein [Terriglobales bacterium]
MNAQQFSAMREIAREIFIRTLAEIELPRILKQQMDYSRGILRIGEDLHDLSSYSRVVVVSIGKAAQPMVEGLTAMTGPGLSGIVVSSQPPQRQAHGFRYFQGGHPLPTTESVHAAEAILKMLRSLKEHALAIYLISGGASAMVEKALDAEVPLNDLAATYHALVNSGAPIREINTIRKHLSAIKGGRMAQAAYPAQQVSVLVSDVPENALDSLASGPTMPDPSTTEECYEIAERYGLLPSLPQSVRELFEQRALEETPKKDDPAFVRSRWWTVLSSSTAAKAAAGIASQHSFAVAIENGCDDWDYREAADYLIDKLRSLQKGVSRACIISAGEVTVKVTGSGGRGGRNQQFALYCAEKIAGENIVILSAGTDGADGNSHAAGAIADGSTMQRAIQAKLNTAAALQNFDSTPFFEALEDAIVTGPTGNNVRDLRVLLAW